jgi:hypothetical protein
MNELNFKPATGGGFGGDRTVAVPALDTSAALTSTAREGAQARHQRRRLNVLRFPSDAGFRLFRVY